MLFRNSLFNYIAFLIQDSNEASGLCDKFGTSSVRCSFLLKIFVIIFYFSKIVTYLGGL